MDKYIHPMFYNGCNNLPVPRLELNHANKASDFEKQNVMLLQ